MRPGTQTITILRGPGTDRHGDPLPGAPDEHVSHGWNIQPGATTETTDGGDTVTADWVAIGPPGADIRATDQVRWRGTTFQVEGDPARWTDEQGRPHHIEVELRQVSG